MAIPGLKPMFAVRAKVRIGVKGRTAQGKEYPKAVDYFVCDDPDFPIGDSKVLRIRFPYESHEDNFSTGMEFWRRSQLACYTKDSGADPVALRVPTLLKETDVVVGEPLKSGRVPIKCPFRQCEFFKSQDCKPMGRLVFFLDEGEPGLGVYELDTKSWNSIEALTGFLSVAGDPRGRVFELSVAFEQRLNQKFPVLALREADVEVKTENDVAIADALIELRKAVGDDSIPIRGLLSNALDATNPGWREKPEFIARIREVGAEQAAIGLLRKYEL